MPDDLEPSAALWDLLASTLEPVPPEADARQRLLAASSGAGRYLPFVTELAECFDLSRERIRALLSQIDDDSAWIRGVEPIQGFLHFEVGPRCEGLHGGLVRMLRGAQVARHRHVDREVTYVVEGTLCDGAGLRYGPGDAIAMAPGSEHSLRVDGDAPVVIALLHGANEMLG